MKKKIAALKFLSANFIIWVILGSISADCIFFPLILGHIFLLGHMSKGENIHL